MTDLVLDLTGTLVNNKVVGEVHDVSLLTDRVFIPAKGAFFGHGVRVINNANNIELQPVTQYRMLELVTDAVSQTKKDVYGVLYINDKNITSVTIEYQAVGGEFQFIADYLYDKIAEYLDGKTSVSGFGKIVNVPVQVQPKHHLQSLNDFHSASALVTSLDSVKRAIQIGDTAAFQAVYDYIGNAVLDAKNALMVQIDALDTHVTNIEDRTKYQDGDYLITDNDINPNVRFGYGKWTLDTNTLLYGAATPSDVGTFVNVGSASDLVARKTLFWRYDESSSGVTYSLGASSSNVNEGSTITFTLTTTGLPNNTAVPYVITGIQAADVIGGNGAINGNFVINNSGVGTKTFTLIADNKTEGAEVMRVSLKNQPNVFATATVNDTSVGATYAVRFSGSSNGAGTITSVDEGVQFYIVVTTTGVADGTVLNLKYDDSVAIGADFSTTLPTTITINSNQGIVGLTPALDQLTENIESFVVNVCTTTNINSMVARNTLSINDTSKSPTFTAKFADNSAGTGSISNINEGSTVYFHIATTNIPDGTVLNLEYYGDASNSDFSTTRPTSVMVSSNKAMVTYAILNDSVTEGTEEFTIKVVYNSTYVAERRLDINDTSIDPTFAVKFSTNANGTDTITTANEGATVYLVVTTTGIANGTVLTLEYGGDANAADFTTTRPTTVTVQSNKASAAYTIKADATTEGAEVMSVAVKSGGITKGSASLNIADTSVAATGTIRFSTSSTGSGTITATNEGATVYAIIETTNVPNGTILNLTYSGTATANDFTGVRPTTATIQSNKASVQFVTKSDFLEEGAEDFTVSTTLPSGATIAGTLTINDTSVPTYALRFSGNSTGTGSITSVNEGVPFWMFFETQGVPVNTTFYVTYDGSNLDLADNDEGDFVTGPINALVTNADGTPWKSQITFRNDNLTDGNKIMIMQIRTGSSNGPVVASAQLAVIDTSKELTFADFDFLVVRYTWSTPNGVDLDTRTFIHTPDRSANRVGYGLYASDPITEPTYLEWAGDNTSAEGSEAVLINMQNIEAAYPAEPTVNIELRAFWWNTRTDGNVRVSFSAYKGGLMYKDGTNWLNDGGLTVGNFEINVNVTDTKAGYNAGGVSDPTQYPGEALAMVTFDTATRLGVLLKIGGW